MTTLKATKNSANPQSPTSHGAEELKVFISTVREKTIAAHACLK